MTSLTVSPASTAHASAAGLMQSRWVWCLLAACLVWLRAWGSGDLAEVWRTYGDTDDATRLLQVRALMAGAGWYDLLIERFGGPTPLVSHWSRLLDVPLALLLWVFGLVLSPANAELALRLIWPSLLLLVLFRVLAHEAECHGGPAAALIALALAATTLTGLFRFLPGRIDHHNVMIIATVAGVLLFLRAIERPRLAFGAGSLLGFALTIGYEPIALIVPGVAIVALVAMVEPRLLLPTRNLVAGLAGALVLGLLVTLPPSVWQLPVCDAIGANLVSAAVIGAVGLALIAAGRARNGRIERLAMLAVTGLVAAGAYAMLSPVCLGGPFAAVSIEAKRLWLDNVLEALPLTGVWAMAPDSAILMVATIALSIGGAIFAHRQTRSVESGALVALLIVAALPTLLAYKLYPYMSFLAVFAIALVIAGQSGTSALPARTRHLAATLFANQATLAVVLVPVVLAVAGGLAPKSAQPAMASGRQLAIDNKGCFDFATMKSLQQLPKGLVVARADLGPFIAASTHHDVLAAPYHRLDRAMLKAHEILTADAEQALQQLRNLGADYVAVCGEAPPKAVAGLTPIPPFAGNPLRLWRITR